MPEVTDDQAWSVAERLLGRRPDRLEAFRPTVGGNDSISFRVRAGEDVMLLKVKKRPGSPVGVYFCRRICEAGVPVPELIAFDAAAGPDGQACALWEWVDGVPAEWSPGEPCPYDEAELGEILRRIHDLTFDGDFGFLGDDPSRRTYMLTQELAATSKTWSGFFLCGRAARRYFDKGYINRREADVLASLPEHMTDELACGTPRLLHGGDIMHNGNLIVDPASGRIRAVVDYVESLAGDPRWELSWFDYYFTQYPFNGVAFDMDRFRAAYGTDHDPQDRLGRFYLAAILLFEKLLFFDPATDRGRWAIRTLKDVLRSFDSGGKTDERQAPV